MPYCCNISAGDNVYLEQKDEEIVIHCCPEPAPQSNIHTGFFQLNFEPETNSRLAVRISNCIFRVNGKYYRIDDYSIKSYYATQELIYLKLNVDDPGRSIIWHELVFNDADDRDNPQLRHLDEPQYILLYILKVKNNRLRVDSYGAGALIDTVLLQEGFVFSLKDGSLNSTVSKVSGGYRHEFNYELGTVYIPAYDAQQQLGVNIKVDNRGGVVWIDKYDEFLWKTTGFSSNTNSSVTVTASSVWI